MKGKILCPAGCQNPVARITKAKEILKNHRALEVDSKLMPFKDIITLIYRRVLIHLQVAQVKYR